MKKWPLSASCIFTNLFLAEAQTFFIIFASIDVAKSLTTCFNSSIVESLQWKTYVMLCPQKKKSRWLRSGLLEGHAISIQFNFGTMRLAISVLFEINLPLNLLSRNSRLEGIVWQVAPPCIKYSWFLVADLFNSSHTFSSIISLCTCWSIMPSTKNGPRTCQLHCPVQHIAFLSLGFALNQIMRIRMRPKEA